jgi:CubicO group peptidase (beta-lactamase class C family)
MTNHPSLRHHPLGRRSLLGLLGVAPLASSVTSRSGPAAGEPPEDLLPGGAFDRFIAKLAAEDQFSGTVLLAYQDRPTLARAYGMADKHLQIPNRVDTIFPLASDGKPFTGVAVTQLAAQGKIDFAASLGTYLDGFPSSIASTVTVHQLLTHTSGMDDYMMTAAWQAGIKTWNSAAEEFSGGLAIIRGAPLLFTPGTQFHYSNSGYFVLGAIVAQVSGLSYYDYVRRHVFAPAGMTHADYYTRPRRLTDPGIAHSYATQPSGQRVDVTADGPFIGTPSGDACASAPDMIRFGRSLVTARLLNPAYTELMTGGKVPSPAGAFQGYGILHGIVNNQQVLLHGGGSPGESTNISIYPDLDWVAVILSNYDVDMRPVVQLQDKLITSAYLGR